MIVDGDAPLDWDPARAGIEVLTRSGRRSLIGVLARAFRDNPMNVRIHGPDPRRRIRANAAGLRPTPLAHAAPAARPPRASPRYRASPAKLRRSLHSRREKMPAAAAVGQLTTEEALALKIVRKKGFLAVKALLESGDGFLVAP